MSEESKLRCCRCPAMLGKAEVKSHIRQHHLGTAYQPFVCRSPRHHAVPVRFTDEATAAHHFDEFTHPLIPLNTEYRDVKEKLFRQILRSIFAGEERDNGGPQGTAAEATAPPPRPPPPELPRTTEPPKAATPPPPPPTQPSEAIIKSEEDSTSQPAPKKTKKTAEATASSGPIAPGHPEAEAPPSAAEEAGGAEAGPRAVKYKCRECCEKGMKPFNIPRDHVSVHHYKQPLVLCPVPSCDFSSKAYGYGLADVKRHLFRQHSQLEALRHSSPIDNRPDHYANIEALIAHLVTRL